MSTPGIDRLASGLRPSAATTSVNRRSSALVDELSRLASFCSRRTWRIDQRSKPASAARTSACSGCRPASLTRYSPLTCFTTSSESPTSSTSRAPSSGARSIPSSSARYSATLLVARPIASPRASTGSPLGGRDDRGDRRRARVAAGAAVDVDDHARSGTRRARRPRRRSRSSRGPRAAARRSRCRCATCFTVVPRTLHRYQESSQATVTTSPCPAVAGADAGPWLAQRASQARRPCAPRARVEDLRAGSAAARLGSSGSAAAARATRGRASRSRSAAAPRAAAPRLPRRGARRRERRAAPSRRPPRAPCTARRPPPRRRRGRR